MQIIKIFILLSTSLLLSTIAQDQPTLIYVQEVFRHGHRYPIYPSSSDGSNYVRQLRTAGQLTKLGKSMHYILGQTLYKQYWNKLFKDPQISKVYNQSKFYVKSTNVNRTIESAQSQLLGIFQNLNIMTLGSRDINYSLPLWPNVKRDIGDVFINSPRFNPIPIHVEKGYMSPWQNGDFLRTYAPQFCPNQNLWSLQNMQRQQILQMINHESFKKAIAELNKALGINVGFFDIYRYYDNSVCMLYEGKQINEIWTKDSPVKRALDFIYRLDVYIKYFYHEEQIATISTGYFNQTYFNFKKVSADQTGVQFALYSAHDTTVANFLARLNMTNPKCIFQNYLNNKTFNNESDTCIIQYPYYTANLIFELYQYKNKEVTIKIRYNGEYRKIPFCDWQYECSVQRYYDWFNSWKKVDYVKRCGIVNEQEDLTQRYFGLMVIQFGIILCFLISALYKYLQGKDKKDKYEGDHKIEQSTTHEKKSLMEQSLKKQSLLSQS